MSLPILMGLEGSDAGDGNFGFGSVFEPFVGVTFLFVVVVVATLRVRYFPMFYGRKRRLRTQTLVACQRRVW